MLQEIIVDKLNFKENEYLVLFNNKRYNYIKQIKDEIPKKIIYETLYNSVTSDNQEMFNFIVKTFNIDKNDYILLCLEEGKIHLLETLKNKDTLINKMLNYFTVINFYNYLYEVI